MEFVTFEIAKKLKEKGFNEECLAYYTSEYTLYTNKVVLCDDKYLEVAEIDYEECLRSFNTQKDRLLRTIVDAPTISQVLKWFRKEHHLHFEVVGAAYGYNLIISDTPDEGGTDRYYSHANDDGPNYAGAWDDYDDCVLYGIEYTLDNLIL